MTKDGPAGLTNKIALVTGASGGIGAAIVRRLHAEGATVYATDLVDPALPKDDKIRFIRLDVTDQESVQATFAQVQNDEQQLDILVNAAGIEIEKTTPETSLEEWNKTFAVNVTGTFLTCKYALPLMRRDFPATTSIINFGSYDGYIADPGLAAYCASKGAVHAFTRALAVDHGPEGVRVNAICPGYIDTPMLQSFFNGEGSGGGGQDIANLQQAVQDIHPMRRYGTPDDVASLVNWLANDEAKYASGQLWTLDGGLTAQVQQMRL